MCQANQYNTSFCELGFENYVTQCRRLEDVCLRAARVEEVEGGGGLSRLQPPQRDECTRGAGRLGVRVGARGGGWWPFWALERENETIAMATAERAAAV